MADADLTYDFSEIPNFVAELDGGAQLVMGNRMDNIKPGAMPWLHRYIGNPLLTGLLNLSLPHRRARRALRHARARRDVLDELDLRTPGMEFASEMVIRAAKARLEMPRSRSSTTRAAASRSCRASATAGAICASCSCTARPTCSSCRGRDPRRLGVFVSVTVLAQSTCSGAAGTPTR